MKGAQNDATWTGKEKRKRGLRGSYGSNRQLQRRQAMNRRQKKKAFKKRFGFNPPRGISIRTATRIMEHKETIIATFERLKAAILDLWERVKQPALELAEALKGCRMAAVLDRCESYNGNGGPLGCETDAALFRNKIRIETVNYIYGLGGRDFTVNDAYAVFDELEDADVNGKTVVETVTQNGAIEMLQSNNQE